MPLKRKPYHLRSKTISFFAKTVKIYQYIEWLMISKNAILFFNNNTMKAVIKDKKKLISELQIGIDGIIYMQKSKLMYSCMKNVSNVTLLDLKKHYIQSG